MHCPITQYEKSLVSLNFSNFFFFLILKQLWELGNNSRLIYMLQCKYNLGPLEKSMEQNENHFCHYWYISLIPKRFSLSFNTNSVRVHIQLEVNSLERLVWLLLPLSRMKFPLSAKHHMQFNSLLSGIFLIERHII